ncbi:hypothetical protein VTI28DRAFT_4902 [Corynascus sepedonium]
MEAGNNQARLIYTAMAHSSSIPGSHCWDGPRIGLLRVLYMERIEAAELFRFFALVFFTALPGLGRFGEEGFIRYWDAVSALGFSFFPFFSLHSLSCFQRYTLTSNWVPGLSSGGIYLGSAWTRNGTAGWLVGFPRAVGLFGWIGSICFSPGFCISGVVIMFESLLLRLKLTLFDGPTKVFQGVCCSSNLVFSSLGNGVRSPFHPSS